MERFRAQYRHTAKMKSGRRIKTPPTRPTDKAKSDLLDETAAQEIEACAVEIAALAHDCLPVRGQKNCHRIVWCRIPNFQRGANLVA